ncbi:MAG TPA: radical SAM protein [Candidatus Nanoarchaeia archaeon]|nr:radical SAM protein [Candidatus Nanoarchaeia archaeon]
MDNFEKLMKEASRIHEDNFGDETWFEKCIFLSWYCDLDCKFCYRPTQKSATPETSKKSLSAILAEAMIIKNLGWKLHFLTSGYGSYSREGFVEIAKKVKEVNKEKTWLNLGVMSNNTLENFRDYIEGVFASIETANEDVQKKVCPKKPMKPYVHMLNNLKNYGKGMAIVIGLGETLDDIPKLHKLIEETKIDKLSMYALTPIKGTEFTHGPEEKYYAEWIARTRIAFPKLEISAGTWVNRVKSLSLVLRAGANSVTKFPMIKMYRSPETLKIREQMEEAGRIFKGNIFDLPDIDWDENVERLSFDDKLKSDIKGKISSYIGGMKESAEKNPLVLAAGDSASCCSS